MPIWTSLPVLVSGGVLAITLALVQYVRESSRLRELPGPPAPSRIAGHAIELQLAKVGTLYHEWGRRYGHTYKLHGPFSQRWLVMADPRGVSHVMSGKASNYELVESSRISNELWFGRGLFVAEGDEHRKMKRMLNPAFTFQAVQEVSHIIFQLADRLKLQWEETLNGSESATFDITTTLHMLSLDAISMTMFMHDLSATEGTIPDLLHNFTNAPSGDMTTLMLRTFVTMFPILLTLPTTMKHWADRLRTELGAIAEQVWIESKADSGMDAKLLKLFNEREDSLSKDEAVAHIIAILFAGSETSANVMTELFYELAVQQKVQNRLREELQDFERTSGHALNYEDLMNPNALPYLDAVVRETVRCKAVLMDIRRQAVEDDVIPLQFPVVGTGADHVRVKAGQIVKIPVRDGINTDEEIWGPDGREFRPERWLESELPPNAELIRAQGHVLTFGDGPKVCLGRLFALAEIKIVVAVILCHFSFEEASVSLDFYHLGGDTVKPKVRGREAEGVQLPLVVTRL